MGKAESIGVDYQGSNVALSEVAAARLAALRAEIDAILAVGALAVLLDPDRRRSRWSVALETESRLRRFEAAAWPRIRDGYRQPRDLLEQALAAILAADGPRSARRLVDLI